jgi:hypothetical protein
MCRLNQNALDDTGIGICHTRIMAIATIHRLTFADARSTSK